MHKLVHIINDLDIGGAEMMLTKLLSTIDQNRFSSTVITLLGGGELCERIEDLGVPVYSLDVQRGIPSLATLLRLRGLMRKLKPDLLVGWMYHGNMTASLARRMLPEHSFLIWNIRQSLYDLAYEKTMTRLLIRLSRFFSKTPDCLLYNSRLSRRHHEKFGYSALKGLVIPNGFDLEAFSFSHEARLQNRSKLGISAQTPVVGHMGRLHHMKDHPLFIEAAVGIADKYPDIHFLLCGRGVVPENELFIRMIPAELRSRFHLLGERSDVAAIMSTLDVFVSSSYAEAFPNVLGEAMAVGIPCVATDVGDSAAVVGNTGIIVKSRDKGSLVSGMERMLTMNEKKRHTLGVMARQRIEENYALRVIAKQHMTLYENIIEGIS